MLTRECAYCGGKFKRRIFAINLGLTRKERCPHCGRWNTFDVHGNNVTSVNGGPDENKGPELEKAEELTEEERLERRIEESKYE